jgi:predicted alpha/beta superfamily hydrolase
MNPRLWSLAGVVIASVAFAQNAVPAISAVAPLAIGETFTMRSTTLGETRRINVYLPPGYAEAPAGRFPVLYMPDGGLAEDFIHVAGLVQVSVGNGTMRPFVLVGIENTQRRRDLTGPTDNPEDKKIAPDVGGSARFRRFIRSELMPVITDRYRTTAERAIVGESLAGYFIVETLFLEPDMFNTYIAFDASLWWNSGALVAQAAERLRSWRAGPKTLYLAASRDDRDDAISKMAGVLGQLAPKDLTWHFEPMPAETHATIYHPAALMAFRYLFKPPSGGGLSR